MVAFWTGPDAGRIERIVRRSGLMREKWDRDDYLARTIAKALEGRTEFYSPSGVTPAAAFPLGARGEKTSAADRIVSLVLSAEVNLFHSPDGTAYATVPRDGHEETRELSSRELRSWAKAAYFNAVRKAPSGQAITDAFGVLEGMAIHESEEHKVHLRLAEHGGTIYLDLCDGGWQSVEISREGWQVIGKSPAKFRRAGGVLPLPVPSTGGPVNDLRRFVNVAEGEWPLLVGWLLAALRPVGPYPILCLHGEQGSAKSTTARVLRSLVDPNSAPLRAEPRNPHELMIAAKNGWVVALDNLSHLPGWLSDAICRLSTGGGFSARRLYTDSDEVLFDAQRPVILNGIEEVATRGDLLERALLLTLPRIPDGDRRTESEFWRDFDAAAPAILGGLLDAVVGGLNDLPNVRLPCLPRMADFAVWVSACEPSLGWPAGTFLGAYNRNRTGANQTALESSPVTRHLLRLIAEGPWRGTAGKLLGELNKRAGDADKRLKDWPLSARALSGTLRRLAPNLRQAGIEVEFGPKRTGTGVQRVITLQDTRPRPSTPSTDAEEEGS